MNQMNDCRTEANRCVGEQLAQASAGKTRSRGIPIIDMHCDTIATLVHCSGNRVLRKNDLAVDLLRMRQANYMCQSFALYTNLADIRKAGIAPFDWGVKLSDRFDEEMRLNADLIRPVTSGTEILQNFRDGYLSALKTVEEGAIYEGQIEKLHDFYHRGVRKSTLTWNYPNELAFPNPSVLDRTSGEYHCVRLDTVNGLTKTGFDFVEEMEALGILIDISHLNDAGIRDVFQIVRRDTPVLASHSNARGAAFHPRNLSDGMIKQLAERGGVCGINYCGAFLNEAYQNTASPKACKSRISDMLAQMKYIRNIGGIDVLGLGSDFDGIEGDLELKGVQDLQKLADAMSLAGFTSGEIEQVFYRNVLRVYQAVLG